MLALPAARAEIRRRNPWDGTTNRRARDRAIESQAADACKNILPAARLTNLGLFGNARAFELLNSKLLSSRVAEQNRIGVELTDALNAVVPEFTSRIGADDWFAKRERVAHVMRASGHRRLGTDPVQLVDPVVVTQELANICRGLVYPSWGATDTWYDASPTSLDDQARLIGSALLGRRSRRDKPPRAFEQAAFTFEMHTTYAAYRDLRRHRLVSRGRTPLGACRSWVGPHELWVESLGDEYEEVMGVSLRLYDAIEDEFGTEVAEYCIPRAMRVRWYLTANLRELYHLIELRSQRQGHPEYRDIAQRMYHALKELHPGLVQGMFVDMSDYGLTRLAAEERKEAKLAALGGGDSDLPA